MSGARHLSIVESFAVSRYGGHGGGGDAVISSEDLVGVVDGVSAKNRLLFDGLASDEFAARAVQNDAVPPLAYRRG